jgi:two-component system NtrC family response regulator
MSDGKRLLPEDLELATNGNAPAASLKDARESLEREMIDRCLRKHAGRITSAALELGISRPTLYELIEKLGISRTA